MNGGAVIPGLPLVVDDFRESLGLTSYMLTHMHADHLKGLRDGWMGGTIYCSEVTRRLLLAKFAISQTRVVALSFDEDHVVRAVEPASGEEVWVSVELLDANHCPGSAMFLLKWGRGRVLHTGDFRLHEDMLSHPSLVSEPLDLIIIDNTYCNPRHDFPPREEARAEILRLVSAHISTHRILIGVDSLGKEELLEAVSRHAGCRIVVAPKRMNSIALAGLDTKRFTLDDKDWRIKLLERHMLTTAEVEAYAQQHPTIGIVASGWGHTSRKALRADNRSPMVGDASINSPLAVAREQAERALPPVDIPKGLIYRVPYSLHSSYAELVQFVSTLKPRSLLPVVASARSNASGDSSMEKEETVCVHTHLGHLVTGPPFYPAAGVPHDRARSWSPVTENCKVDGEQDCGGMCRGGDESERGGESDAGHAERKGQDGDGSEALTEKRERKCRKKVRDPKRSVPEFRAFVECEDLAVDRQVPLVSGADSRTARVAMPAIVLFPSDCGGQGGGADGGRQARTGGSEVQESSGRALPVFMKGQVPGAKGWSGRDDCRAYPKLPTRMGGGGGGECTWNEREGSKANDAGSWGCGDISFSGGGACGGSRKPRTENSGQVTSGSKDAGTGVWEQKQKQAQGDGDGAEGAARRVEGLFQGQVSKSERKQHVKAARGCAGQTPPEEGGDAPGRGGCDGIQRSENNTCSSDCSNGKGGGASKACHANVKKKKRGRGCAFK